jgi:hypothetical protein
MNGTTVWVLRGMRVMFLAALGVVTLLSGIVLWQLGPREAFAAGSRKLDDLHIYGPKAELRREARRLNRADPVADARDALRAGDERLLALATIGPYLPGVDEQGGKFEAYRREFGVRFLAVGCVISGREEAQFRDAANAYARKYNPIISAGGTASSARCLTCACNGLVRRPRLLTRR